MEKSGEINGANHSNNARNISSRPTVSTGPINPFATDPCGHEQQGEAFLELDRVATPSRLRRIVPTAGRPPANAPAY